MELADVPLDASCVECRRALAVDGAFTSDDGKLYCGSCAPAGSAPARVELSDAPVASTSTSTGGPSTRMDILRAFVGDLVGWKRK